MSTNPSEVQIPSEVPTEVQTMDRSSPQDNDGNDNLRDNQVDVEIKPDTHSNILHFNLCSFTITFCNKTPLPAP